MATRHAERHLDVDVLEVVLACALQLDVAARRPARRRRRDRSRPGQVLPGQRMRIAPHLLRRALRHHLAAVATGAGAEVDDVVGRLDGRLRRAPPPARCCRGRAAGAASGSGARCRAGADRSTARPARTARRSARSRAARPAGCAAPRRPTATPRCGPGSGSRGRRRAGTTAARGSPCAPRPRSAPARRPAASRRSGATPRPRSSPVTSVIGLLGHEHRARSPGAGACRRSSCTRWRESTSRTGRGCARSRSRGSGARAGPARPRTSWPTSRSCAARST